MILREGLNVRVVLLPDGEDPDSFGRSHSAEEVRAYIEGHEEDFIRFKTRLLMADAGDDPLKRAALVTDIVQSISEIPDPIVRSVFIKDCAKSMDVDEQVLVAEVARETPFGAVRPPDRRFSAQHAGSAPPRRAGRRVAGLVQGCDCRQQRRTSWRRR